MTNVTQPPAPPQQHQQVHMQSLQQNPQYHQFLLQHGFRLAQAQQQMQQMQQMGAGPSSFQQQQPPPMINQSSRPPLPPASVPLQQSHPQAPRPTMNHITPRTMAALQKQQQQQHQPPPMINTSHGALPPTSTPLQQQHQSARPMINPSPQFLPQNQPPPMINPPMNNPPMISPIPGTAPSTSMPLQYEQQQPMRPMINPSPGAASTSAMPPHHEQQQPGRPMINPSPGAASTSSMPPQHEQQQPGRPMINLGGQKPITLPARSLFAYEQYLKQQEAARNSPDAPSTQQQQQQQFSVQNDPTDSTAQQADEPRPPPPDIDLSQWKWEDDKLLNMYIVDYFVKRNFQQSLQAFFIEAQVPREFQVPIEAPQGFLYEWWSVFWDIFRARSGKGSKEAIVYVEAQAIKNKRDREARLLLHQHLTGMQRQLTAQQVKQLQQYLQQHNQEQQQRQAQQQQQQERPAPQQSPTQHAQQQNQQQRQQKLQTRLSHPPQSPALGTSSAAAAAEAAAADQRQLTQHQQQQHAPSPTPTSATVFSVQTSRTQAGTPVQPANPSPQDVPQRPAVMTGPPPTPPQPTQHAPPQHHPHPHSHAPVQHPQALHQMQQSQFQHQQLLQQNVSQEQKEALKAMGLENRTISSLTPDQKHQLCKVMRQKQVDMMHEKGSAMLLNQGIGASQQQQQIQHQAMMLQQQQQQRAAAGGMMSPQMMNMDLPGSSQTVSHGASPSNNHPNLSIVTSVAGVSASLSSANSAGSPVVTPSHPMITTPTATNIPSAASPVSEPQQIFAQHQSQHPQHPQHPQYPPHAQSQAFDASKLMPPPAQKRQRISSTGSFASVSSQGSVSMPPTTSAPSAVAGVGQGQYHLQQQSHPMPGNGMQPQTSTVAASPVLAPGGVGGPQQQHQQQLHPQQQSMSNGAQQAPQPSPVLTNAVPSGNAGDGATGKAAVATLAMTPQQFKAWATGLSNLGQLTPQQQQLMKQQLAAVKPGGSSGDAGATTNTDASAAATHPPSAQAGVATAAPSGSVGGAASGGANVPPSPSQNFAAQPMTMTLTPEMVAQLQSSLSPNQIHNLMQRKALQDTILARQQQLAMQRQNQQANHAAAASQSHLQNVAQTSQQQQQQSQPSPQTQPGQVQQPAHTQAAASPGNPAVVAGTSLKRKMSGSDSPMISPAPVPVQPVGAPQQLQQHQPQPQQPLGPQAQQLALHHALQNQMIQQRHQWQQQQQVQEHQHLHQPQMFAQYPPPHQPYPVADAPNPQQQIMPVTTMQSQPTKQQTPSPQQLPGVPQHLIMLQQHPGMMNAMGVPMQAHPGMVNQHMLGAGAHQQQQVQHPQQTHAQQTHQQAYPHVQMAGNIIQGSGPHPHPGQPTAGNIQQQQQAQHPAAVTAALNNPAAAAATAAVMQHHQFLAQQKAQQLLSQAQKTAQETVAKVQAQMRAQTQLQQQQQQQNKSGHQQRSSPAKPASVPATTAAATAMPHQCPNPPMPQQQQQQQGFGNGAAPPAGNGDGAPRKDTATGPAQTLSTKASAPNRAKKKGQSKSTPAQPQVQGSHLSNIVESASPAPALTTTAMVATIPSVGIVATGATTSMAATTAAPSASGAEVVMGTGSLVVTPCPLTGESMESSQRPSGHAATTNPEQMQGVSATNAVGVTNSADNSRDIEMGNAEHVGEPAVVGQGIGGSSTGPGSVFEVVVKKEEDSNNNADNNADNNKEKDENSSQLALDDLEALLNEPGMNIDDDAFASVDWLTGEATGEATRAKQDPNDFRSREVRGSKGPPSSSAAEDDAFSSLMDTEGFFSMGNGEGAPSSIMTMAVKASCGVGANGQQHQGRAASEEGGTSAAVAARAAGLVGDSGRVASHSPNLAAGWGSQVGSIGNAGPIGGVVPESCGDVSTATEQSFGTGQGGLGGNVLRPLASLTGHTQKVSSCCFDPTGAIMASAGHDRKVHVWDARKIILSGMGSRTALAATLGTSGVSEVARLCALEGHTSHITNVRFMNLGNVLDPATRNSSLVSSISSRSSPATPNSLISSPSSAAATFSQHMLVPELPILLATSSADKTVRIWEFKNMRIGDAIRTRESTPTQGLTGTTVNGGNKGDSESAPQLLLTYTGHNRAVTSVDFCPVAVVVAPAGPNAADSASSCSDRKGNMNGSCEAVDQVKVWCGSLDAEGEMRIWEARTGKTMKSIKLPASSRCSGYSSNPLRFRPCHSNPSQQRMFLATAFATSLHYVQLEITAENGGAIGEEHVHMVNTPHQRNVSSLDWSADVMGAIITTDFFMWSLSFQLKAAKYQAVRLCRLTGSCPPVVQRAILGPLSGRLAQVRQLRRSMTSTITITSRNSKNHHQR
ncbi:hypothetical protein HK102_012554 [Quaeritorhiza haematococci]|nr:hypothetical protein HK102_012554 [Quaeritorhiza haematococci]